MPLPVTSGLRFLTTHVKDRQIQKRINEALGIRPQPKVKAAKSLMLPAGAPVVPVTAVAWSAPVVTVIFRGLARSATGMRSFSTPDS